MVLVPYVVHLLVLVTSILYAACHQSLALREEIPKEGEAGYDPDVVRETMKAEDAYQFPLVGSMSLFGLYLAFKFLGKEWVNLLIGGYFGLVGCGALTLTLSPLAAKLLPPSLNEKNLGFKKKIEHPLPSWILPTPLDVGIEFTYADLLAFVGSAAIVAAYFQKKHWTLNNVLGICFCLQGIEKFSLGTYKIGAILLCGLFFYDIFWVFGTDVMVTVAKNLDGPIKLLFPRSLIPKEEDGKIELSLLGLGDIVIPGASPLAQVSIWNVACLVSHCRFTLIRIFFGSFVAIRCSCCQNAHKRSRYPRFIPKTVFPHGTDRLHYGIGYDSLCHDSIQGCAASAVVLSSSLLGIITSVCHS